MSGAAEGASTGVTADAGVTSATAAASLFGIDAVATKKGAFATKRRASTKAKPALATSPPTIQRRRRSGDPRLVSSLPCHSLQAVENARQNSSTDGYLRAALFDSARR